MKVGFVGLGKLGLPCALAAEKAGHEVMGVDIDPIVTDILKTRVLPYKEELADEYLQDTEIKLTDERSLVEWADIVFVAVQTPHQPQFEGVTRLGTKRADFDYSWLEDAVRGVREAKLVVVISTVLPGTMQRFFDFQYARPETLLYNPFFIAMGTTIHDFQNPEFVLVGSDGAHAGPLREFYAPIHGRQMFVTTVKTAELTKVAYNTFIGLKIAFGNTMMEMCEKIGADVDDLVDVLSVATQRIISPAYMRGGMGDGGGCHPRDNIALSWLARELGLSYDIFTALMECREKQTEWLADLALEEAERTKLPIELLGKAYKPETNLTVGSPARLLASILEERGRRFAHSDPYAE